MFTVRKNYPLGAKLQLKSERWLCSFPDVIGIAFGNEVPLTPKLISLLQRSTFLLFFEKKYSKLAYLLVIWAPKRLSKSGWNGKTMSKGLKTRRELAAEMKLHSTRHVMDARAIISIFEMEFPIFFYPTGAFMATSFIYFWVQGARKYLRSFGMLVLAWGSHF